MINVLFVKVVFTHQTNVRIFLECKNLNFSGFYIVMSLTDSNLSQGNKLNFYMEL